MLYIWKGGGIQIVCKILHLMKKKSTKFLSNYKKLYTNIFTHGIMGINNI